MTWMVWGIAVCGIFMTYGFLATVAVAYGANVQLLFPIAWAPWVAMAWVASGLMWRSVALTVPIDRPVTLLRSFLAGLVFVGNIATTMFLAPALGLSLVEPALILLALGDALIIVGVLGLLSTSRTERLLWIAGGAALGTVALVAAALIGADRAAAYAWFSLVSPLATALVFFFNGIYLSLTA